ncbi:Membrane protein tms1 [Cladophialophora chaetospira]|uniref:Membrane protein tms1 n=1 Tax=Cladophialophora chaetospira TaxID=386627 RepID=A0AA38XIV0_9EURO|nr:Membrane protein tms1 [Cladophialophora chaetospira]
MSKFRSSIATRIAYAMMLLVNSIIAWIMLTPWAIRKLEHLTLDYMTFKCGSSDCYGYFAVQRINFALGIYHLLLSVLLIGVQSTKDTRAGLQNGFWGPKILAWLAFVVISFLIPEGFFLFWGNYVAYFGAMLFVLLGLILLVDLAHTWAELCQDKIDEGDGPNYRLWQVLLMGSSLGMYLAAFAMTGVMYWYFAGSGCSMNISAITINLVVLCVITLLSVQPAIQDANPKAGLAQAAMVAVYCTYLTFSAVAMEPDDKHCNPLVRARGARTTTVVMGAIVTMLTIAYTTTRAATQGFAMGNNTNTKKNKYAQLTQDDYEHGLVTQQPASRREIMRAAVESGALPASALDEDSDDEEETEVSTKDDERQGTQYNYSLFHIIFLLATCWVATLLTQKMDPESSSDFSPVGRTYWASWIKIISAWVCYAIYSWTLVAPIVLEGREFS